MITIRYQNFILMADSSDYVPVYQELKGVSRNKSKEKVGEMNLYSAIKRGKYSWK